MILDRTPPHDQAAERAVVGSILIDPRRIDDLAQSLHGSDFHNAACGRLYSHLRAMADAGDQIDVPLLMDRLRKAGELEAVGGAALIAEAIQSVAVPSHAAHYGRIVQRDSRKRQLIRAATDMLPVGRPRPDDARRVLNTLVDQDRLLRHRPSLDVGRDHRRMADRRHHQGQRSRRDGRSAAIRRDRRFFRGELVIPARPGQGKTSRCKWRALRLSWQAGVFRDAPDGSRRIGAKATGSESGVSNQKIRRQDRRARPDPTADAATRVATGTCNCDWPESDHSTSASRAPIQRRSSSWTTCRSPRHRKSEKVGDIAGNSRPLRDRCVFR